MELWNFSKFVKSFLGLGYNRGLHVRERASAGSAFHPRQEATSIRLLRREVVSFILSRASHETDASARGEPIVVDVFFPFS